MQEGGCLCSGVRYKVASEPSDVINCNCRFCQRSTGAAYMVEMLFAKKDFVITDGATKVYEHVSEDSGKMVYVNFCANCGTKLFLTFERFPTFVGVYAGTFDDPNWFHRTPENTRYFCLSKAQYGTVLPAGFEVFHDHYRQSDGIVCTPQIFDEHTVVSSEVKKVSETFAKQHRAKGDAQ